MAITTSRAFPKHLDGDISKIWFDTYSAYKGEYDKIAKVGEAPAGGHITEAELSGLGALREVPEGTGIQFDIPTEGYEKTRYYTQYGLGFQVTPIMVKDDLFGNFKRMPEKLAKSSAQKPETVFWDLFNNGFATHVSMDADYIFSTSHTPLKSGSDIGNRPSSDAALSYTTLQAAFEYYWNLLDDQGMPMVIDPNLLVCPTELTWTAESLRRTMGGGGTGSADNAINPVNPDQNPTIVKWQPFYSRYLTSSTAWFLLSPEHDFRLLWKERFGLEAGNDFSTGNRLYKTVGRFTCFCNRWRGAYGTTGA